MFSSFSRQHVYNCGKLLKVCAVLIHMHLYLVWMSWNLPVVISGIRVTYMHAKQRFQKIAKSHGLQQLLLSNFTYLQQFSHTILSVRLD